MRKLLVVILECPALHIRRLVEFAVQSDGSLKAIDRSSFVCGERHSPVIAVELRLESSAIRRLFQPAEDVNPFLEAVRDDLADD
jgi:hypothetical protein